MMRMLMGAASVTVTHYFTNDANMNVTALLDTSGDVVERYEYDGYGRAHVLDADYSSDADQFSDHAQDVLFAGYLHVGETFLRTVRVHRKTAAESRSHQESLVADKSRYQLELTIRETSVIFGIFKWRVCIDL